MSDIFHSPPAPSGDQRSDAHPIIPGLPSFNGFRTGTRPITLPVDLFAEVLPDIGNEAELRVTLHVLYAIGRLRGALRTVRRSELVNDSILNRGLAHCGGVQVLSDALQLTVARGTLIDCLLDDDDVLYFVNNEGGRRLRERIRSGAQSLADGRRAINERLPIEPTSPAKVYEQEVGTLTPAIASQLSDAEAHYPTDWVIEALQLAATNNARSWRYAEAILRRWESEGRENEATRGNARATDPYSHVYRRE